MSQPLTLTSLPLFPLASLLFPGGMLALRVFDAATVQKQLDTLWAFETLSSVTTALKAFARG